MYVVLARKTNEHVGSAADLFCITHRDFVNMVMNPYINIRNFTVALTGLNINECEPSNLAHSVTLQTSIQEVIISSLVRDTESLKDFVV